MRSDVWAGGVVAGLTAGLAQLASGFVLGTVAGPGGWPMVKLASFPAVGVERALDPAYDPFAVAVGMALEFAVTVAGGLVFASLFRGLTAAGTVVAGVAFGLVAWLLGNGLLLPAVGLHDVATALPLPASLLQHVLGGLGLGVGFAPFQQPIRVFLPSPWDIDRPLR